MSFVFINDSKEYDVGLTSIIEEVIPFDDNYIAFIFRSKEYQIWEIRTDKLIRSGRLKQDVRLIRLLNEEEILYLTIQGEMGVLNAFSDSNVWKFQVKLPTFATIVASQQLNESFPDATMSGQMLIASVNVVVSRKHQLICLSEIVNVGFASTKQIFTIFNHRSGPSPIAAALVEEKDQMKASFVNENFVVLWSQMMFNKKTPKQNYYIIWDLQKNTQREVTIQEPKNDDDAPQCSSVISFQPIEGDTRALSFENTNSYPRVKIINIENGKVLVQRILEQYGKTSIISDAVFFCQNDEKLNRDFNVLYLDMEGEDSTRIESYNLSKSLKYIKKSGELKKKEATYYSIAPKGNTVKEN